MNEFKPNAVLPAGAELLVEPVEKQLGNYIPLKYDAKCIFYGITWYRVYRGLSYNNDREDWVADLPGVHSSITDYQWRREGMTFQKCLSQAIRQASESLAAKVDKLIKDLRICTESMFLLTTPAVADLNVELLQELFNLPAEKRNTIYLCSNCCKGRPHGGEVLSIIPKGQHCSFCDNLAVSERIVIEETK